MSDNLKEKVNVQYQLKLILMKSYLENLIIEKLKSEVLMLI